jgi:hypothetical protein
LLALQLGTIGIIPLTFSFLNYIAEWKSRERFEPRVATRAMPEVTNYLIIQEFCLVGCNDFVVASNTLDAKQGHGASFFHRDQQACIGSLNDEDLPRGRGDYVTASGTIITLA